MAGASQSASGAVRVAPCSFITGYDHLGVQHSKAAKDDVLKTIIDSYADTFDGFSTNLFKNWRNVFFLLNFFFGNNLVFNTRIIN